MNENKANSFFYIFIISHLFIWTLIPFFSNINLPLDTIEALAWGSNLDWGFEKHPPLSALAVEIIFSFFGNNDWAYYLLSQICVIIAFIYVWKFSKLILKNNTYALFSILLLECLYFYNFTTPEFNVNVCQLPFWALTVFYTYKALFNRKKSDFALMGIFMGLGFLTKYLFIYLILAIKIIFILKIIKEKKFYFKYFIPGLIFIALTLPHFVWLFENNFVTINYAFQRTGIQESTFITNLKNPFIFILKQIGIIVPLIFLFYLLIDKKKFDFSKLKTNHFLLSINLIPIILILLTSVLTGAKIRTMWLTPFYLFIGVLIVYLFQLVLLKKNYNKFFIMFCFFFFLSPSIYAYVSISNDFKRTDYEGREIANLVQRKWDQNFKNKISIVVGDEWYAGNLSYHLESRPKWFNTIENNLEIINSQTGVIYTGNPKILKKSCPGIYGTIRPVGYCMIGLK